MKATAMKNLFSKYLTTAALALCLATPGARGFALLGPPTQWQLDGNGTGFNIGYMLPGEIGAPVALHEGFRWNVSTITYAFDKTFIDYFGPDGVIAVNEAMQYFNDLDPASKISPDLSDYSTSTLRQNYEARDLGLLDLKSYVMSLMMEELGLADPIRFTFTLRARSITMPPGGAQPFTNYTTIMRNYDPVTLQLSPYVNDTLWTYDIEEFTPPPLAFADAVELPVSGDVLSSYPVASGVLSGGALAARGNLTVGLLAALSTGNFYTGLTRDDVGGLRYQLHPNNYAVESLLATVTQGRGSKGNPWLPFLGTNTTTVTNIFASTATNFVVTGLRGGRDHYTFKQVRFDSLLGSGFKPITNSYTDVVFTNGSAVVQHVQRGIIQPDIIFVAEDLGLQLNLTPFLVRRTTTAIWTDNDVLNGADETALSHGPGVIPPQVRISFSNILPYFSNNNLDNDLPGETDAFKSFVWGKFDGSTNVPVIFPINNTLSISQLRQRLLHPPASE